ncbi:MAG: LamB/YcsF family protein [Actinomycetota bacterium]|nr:LamB/YcsF family protein [Actinomycetota bacterium]
MGRRIDLNADLAEGSQSDDVLMRHITSASIACGGHAGDEDSMHTAVTQALDHAVRIGAHPSYPDVQGFGRRPVVIDQLSLEADLKRQVASLIDIADSLGAKVAYIKPHGALYNEASTNMPPASEAIARVARFFGLPLMVLAGSPITKDSELDLITEGFIDRRYTVGGRLRSRDERDALITDPGEAIEQALGLAPEVDSLCVHSDSLNALELLKATRACLLRAGFVIGP